MDSPTTCESVDHKQPATAEVLGCSRANLMHEPGALVDHLATDDLVVEAKPEDHLTDSMNRRIGHQFRDHKGQLAQSLRADPAGQMPSRRGSSDTGSGRVLRKVERKIVGHDGSHAGEGPTPEGARRS